MKVKVSPSWSGNSNYGFILEFKHNGRFYSKRISRESGDYWDREYATKALDVLQNVYHVERRSVRFEHR